MTSPAKKNPTNIKQSPIIQGIVQKVNTPPSAKSDPAPSAAAPKTGGFFSKILPPMNSNVTPFQPGKYFTAMFILLIGLYVIQFGLIYIDNITHGSLNNPVFLNLGIIQLNPMNTIFIALIFGMYWMLIHFNILPRSGAVRSRTSPAISRNRIFPVIPYIGKSAAQKKTQTVSVTTVENTKASKKSLQSENSKSAAHNNPETDAASDNTPSEPTAGDEIYNRYLSQSRALARKKKNR